MKTKIASEILSNSSVLTKSSISSATNSTSSDTVASSGAVKTSYDLANTAKTAAATAQTAANTAQTKADSAYTLADSAIYPDAYWRPSLFTTAKTSVTLPSGMRVVIGGKQYSIGQNVTLKLSTLGAASTYTGKDVYIYACAPTSGTSFTPVLSLNSTVPTGYTASNSRKIGGFHCLCAAVGTISGHSLTGFAAGNILPLSPWDLRHRPVSDAEGMVWIKGINKWVDIYLPSWNGSKFISAFGATIADGASATKFNGERFAEYAPTSNKILCSRDEFIYFAKGSNEGTQISTGADPGTTGGHTDTAGRRMISNYGLEDCCGALWQWSREYFEDTPGSTWNGSDGTVETPNFYLSGYAWNNYSVYNANYDAQEFGSCHGFLRRLLLGGDWIDGAHCGSRCSNCHCFSSGGWSSNSARLVSEPLSQF